MGKKPKAEGLAEKQTREKMERANDKLQEALSGLTAGQQKYLLMAACNGIEKIQDDMKISYGKPNKK